MSIFSYLIIVTLTFGCTSGKISQEAGKQENDCLTIENFNSIADYVISHGNSVLLSDRLLAEKESVSLEITVGNRFIELEDYQDSRRIIVIDKSPDNKIPAYFLTIENNEILISPYSSRIDVEKDVKARKEDWCNIISEFAQIR